MLKKIATLLLITITSLLFTTTAMADLESIQKGSTSTNSIKRENNDNDDDNDGGYTTQVDILDQKKYIVDRQYSADDFKQWVAVFNLIEANDYYANLIKTNRISKTGIVQNEDLKLNKKTIKSGKTLEFCKVKKWTKQKNSSSDFFNLLKKENIIKANNHIGITDYITFETLNKTISSLPLGIKNKPLAQATGNDFFNFLLNESTIYEVTHKESTRYESNKDNFVNNLVDYTAGSFFGKLIYKDKVKVNKSKRKWASGVTIQDYVGTSHYIGFADYPFQNGISGQTALLGKVTRKVAALSLSSDDDVTYNTFSVDILGINQKKGFSGPNIIGGFHFQYDSIRENNRSNSIGLYSTSLQFGVTGTNIEALFGIGISLYNDLSNDSSIGFNKGFKATYYPFNPFRLMYSIKNHFQGQTKDDIFTKNWSLTQHNLELGINIKQVELLSGYKYLNGDQSNLYENSYFGIRLTF